MGRYRRRRGIGIGRAIGRRRGIKEEEGEIETNGSYDCGNLSLNL